MIKYSNFIMAMCLFILSCHQLDKTKQTTDLKDIAGTWYTSLVLPSDSSILASPSGGSAFLFLAAFSSQSKFLFKNDSFWVNNKWTGFYSIKDNQLYGLNSENNLEKAIFKFNKDTLLLSDGNKYSSTIILKLIKQ